MELLYDNLINRSAVLDKLNLNLIISNVIIIKNDPVNKSNKLIKTCNGKRDYNTIESIISQTKKYRNQLINLKSYFDNQFKIAKDKKILLNINKHISDICVKCMFIYLFIY